MGAVAGVRDDGVMRLRLVVVDRAHGHSLAVVQEARYASYAAPVLGLADQILDADAPPDIVVVDVHEPVLECDLPPAAQAVRTASPGCHLSLRRGRAAPAFRWGR